MTDDCLFCKISKGEVPVEKIYENDSFFVINDASPVSEGHCLIIPKKHFDNVFDMPVSMGGELLEACKTQGFRLIDEGNADGIKLVNNNFDASGQVIKHFHMHVIPEKENFKRERSV